MQLGILVGPAFDVSYALLGVFTGGIADAVHRPRLMACGIALSSIMVFISSMVSSFVAMLLPRLLSGVGLSVMGPACLALIREMFPGGRQGAASGIYGTSTSLGFGLSLVVSGYLAPWVGWRQALVTVASVGLVVAVIVGLVADPRPADARKRVGGSLVWYAVQRSLDSTRRACVIIYGCRSWIFMLIGGAGGGLKVSGNTYLQIWLHEERGFSTSFSAISFGLVDLGTFLFFLPAMGQLADWMRWRLGVPRIAFAGAAVALAIPFRLTFLFSAANSPLFWTMQVLSMGVDQGTYGAVAASVNDLAPVSQRATFVGVSFCVRNLVGFGIGSAIAGRFLDLWIHHKTVEQPYTSMLAITWVLGATVQSIFYWLAACSYESDRDRERQREHDRLAAAKEPIA